MGGGAGLTVGDWLRPSSLWLLVFVPVAIVARFVDAPVAAFLASGLAIVPLAQLIGESTEELAIHVGPRLGGLLNATFGNLTELIVAVFLVLANEFDVVKASLVGSILGNLLLVLGVAFVAGGARRSEQEFDVRAAGVHSASLLLAVAALLLPAILVVGGGGRTTAAGREGVSLVVAAVLVACYLAALIFTQVTHSHLFHAPNPSETARWSRNRAVLVLLASGVAVGIMSEILVAGLEPSLKALHLSPLFVGLILIPVIGNAAEHSSAVIFAMKDKLTVTLEIAIGSSTQVALFVAPVVVVLSLLLSHPMDFVFTAFEIAAVGLATLIVSVIVLDGRSNWLEGAQLLGAYVIVAGAAFFLGGPPP